MAPSERLPDPAPFPIFFLPNFLGIAFALAFERLGVETFLSGLLHEDAHRYSLLGLGVFAIANANSYLGGSVVLARIKYDVKLPNLYANPDNKNAVLFNCIQRGHQNFLESYPQLVLSILSTALLADRPNVAGLLMLVIAACRISYAIGYKSNITSRMAGQLLSIFAMSTGIGYCLLLGISILGFSTGL